MDKIFALNGVVINPRFAGIRVSCGFLRDGIIYGTTMDSNANTVQYDVMSGIIEDYDHYQYQEEIKSINNYLQSYSTFVSEEQVKEAYHDWYVNEKGHTEMEWSQHQIFETEQMDSMIERNREVLKKRARAKAAGGEVAALPPTEKRLLVALANHQVSGDEIIKGLKANGLDLNVKLQESYLGGWNASGCSLVELLQGIRQRSE